MKAAGSKCSSPIHIDAQVIMSGNSRPETPVYRPPVDQPSVGARPPDIAFLRPNKLGWLRFVAGVLLFFVLLESITGSEMATHNDIVLGQAAADLARAGRIEEAKRIAAQISNEFVKEGAYGEIAVGQAHVGQFAEAEATMAKYCRRSNNSTAYRWITEAQIKANDLSGAKASLAHVRPENCRGELLRQLADAQVKVGDMAGAEATRSQLRKEFGDPKMERLEEILLLIAVAVLGTTAVLLYMADLWKRSAQFLAAFALFLTIPAGIVFVFPIPFFLLLMDSIFGGRGFAVMGERYWQLPQSVYVMFTLFLGAAIALGVERLMLHGARWMRQRLGRAAWVVSFPLFVGGTIIFYGLMFVILVSVQYMRLYDSCLWLPWEHVKL